MPEKPGACIRVRGAKEYYLAHLYRAADQKALLAMQPYAVVACPKKSQEKCVRVLLHRLGLENVRVCAGAQAQVRSYETGFFLSRDGRRVRIADSRGTLSVPQTALLGVLALLDQGERNLVLRAEDPPAAQTLCKTANAAFRVARDEEAYARALADFPSQKDFHEDGLYAFVCLLSCFVRARTIPRALLDAQVHAGFCEEEVACARTRVARVLGALSQELDAPWESGAVNALTPGGSVTLSAAGRQGRIRILTQAGDTEAARELCAQMTQRVGAKIREMSPPAPNGQEHTPAQNSGRLGGYSS